MNHAAQLLASFNPRAVELQDDVVLLNTGLACRGVLIHHYHFHAALFLKLELLGALGVHLGHANAQKACRPAEHLHLGEARRRRRLGRLRRIGLRETTDRSRRQPQHHN